MAKDKIDETIKEDDKLSNMTCANPSPVDTIASDTIIKWENVTLKLQQNSF